MIKYKLKEQVNPTDLAAPNKFIPVKQKQEALTLRDFVKRISRESTVSSMFYGCNGSIGRVVTNNS